MACTIFSVNNVDNTYFCNNEDWYSSNTKITVRPGDGNGYGLLFWSFSEDYEEGGINEVGLSWDWVAGSRTGWKRDSNKLNHDDTLAVKILQECATVDEALSYYQRYNEPDFEAAAILLSDRTGNSAIAGWQNGRVVIEQSTGAHQVMGYGEQHAMARLAQNPKISVHALASILRDARQEGLFPTQYSTIHDSRNGVVSLFYQQNFEEFVALHVQSLLNQGAHTYDMASQFSQMHNES